MMHSNRIGRLSFVGLSPILLAVLCVACDKAPEPNKAPAADAPAATSADAPQATGLVKNPVKMRDTADAVKWMDMASTKSPAQVAKEEKLALDAKNAKLAADAKAAHDAQLAADAKTAADLKAAADATAAAIAKAAADAKALAAAQALEAQKAQAAAQAAAQAKAAQVAVQEPVLKLLSQEQPKFPKNAVADGITSGMVTAQAQIEADGHISNVKILKASPAKYFDKAVIAAVSRWKYAPIAQPTNTKLEFSFKYDGDTL
jgi:protein TonB